MSDPGDETARRNAARRVLRATRQREAPAPLLTPEQSRQATPRRGVLFAAARLCFAAAIGLFALGIGLALTALP
jgi:hypothetical protein